MKTFVKYEALGNDYLVLEAKGDAAELGEEFIRKVCDRHFGVGSDGILFGPLESHVADFRLKIFNPDGSEAEKSGNGLRIFSRHLLETKRVIVGKTFTVGYGMMGKQLPSTWEKGDY